MSHVILWICKFTIAFGLLFNLTACALFAERPAPPMSIAPREQVYSASYDEIWKAVNLVLQPYPLRISNMDQGLLETDVLRGDKVWTSPYEKTNPGSGETYRLSIRVIKGAQNQRAATKVIIQKDAQVQVDFFSDPKPMSSDGMEERSILYRIGREIQIERALVRAQKKQNQQQN